MLYMASVVSNTEPCLLFQLGEKGSGLRARGEVQDFFKIRDQCLEEGTLFEDPEFPAEDSSIYFSKTPPRPLEWKRPIVS
jgi:calpain